MQSIKRMIFVDGSNFLIELSKYLKINFRADKPPPASLELARRFLDVIQSEDQKYVVRTYWFSSYQGDDSDFERYRHELRKRGFEPCLFKRRNKKEKGVDIALATEMLTNAFEQNYSEAMLVAGDEDYVRLVEAAKHYGPRIIGRFFRSGISERLRLTYDEFLFVEDFGFGEHSDQFISSLRSQVE